MRNSLDHGIEEKEVRAAKGKPVTGNLTLSAEHHGGNIVIEVSDDGAGLNREKILAKARSQGMTISDTMSDDDVLMLIFAAGFSTAESVTDVSGRGVGMDVVRRNIRRWAATWTCSRRRGRDHHSHYSAADAGDPRRHAGEGGGRDLRPAAGRGDGVAAADRRHAVPLCRRRAPLQVRGEYLPLVLLRQRLSVAGEAPADDGIVVIVQSAGCRYALWVDQLIGQQQVVVKNLEHNYRKVRRLCSDHPR